MRKSSLLGEVYFLKNCFLQIEESNTKLVSPSLEGVSTAAVDHGDEEDQSRCARYHLPWSARKVTEMKQFIVGMNELDERVRAAEPTQIANHVNPENHESNR